MDVRVVKAGRYVERYAMGFSHAGVPLPLQLVGRVPVDMCSIYAGVRCRVFWKGEFGCANRVREGDGM